MRGQLGYIIACIVTPPATMKIMNILTNATKSCFICKELKIWQTIKICTVKSCPAYKTFSMLTSPQVSMKLVLQIILNHQQILTFSCTTEFRIKFIIKMPTVFCTLIVKKTNFKTIFGSIQK